MGAMNTNQTPNARHSDALKEAIRLAGGLASFVSAVKAPSNGAVKAWIRNGVPAGYCPTIERVTGVPCERLNSAVEWTVLRKPLPVAPAANDAQM